MHISTWSSSSKFSARLQHKRARSRQQR